MTLRDRWNIVRRTVSMMSAQEKEEKQRRKQMRVNRTTEGTVFEVACGLTVAAATGLKLWEMARSHTVDIGELIGLLLFVAAIATLLVSAYRPHWINYVCDFDERIENARQLTLLVRSVRVMALYFALWILLIAASDLAGWERPEWSKYIDMAFFLAVPIYYSIRIHKAK